MAAMVLLVEEMMYVKAGTVMFLVTAVADEN